MLLLACGATSATNTFRAYRTYSTGGGVITPPYTIQVYDLEAADGSHERCAALRALPTLPEAAGRWRAALPTLPQAAADTGELDDRAAEMLTLARIDPRARRAAPRTRP